MTNNTCEACNHNEAANSIGLYNIDWSCPIEWNICAECSCIIQSSQGMSVKSLAMKFFPNDELMMKSKYIDNHKYIPCPNYSKYHELLDNLQNNSSIEIDLSNMKVMKVMELDNVSITIK